MSRDEIQIAKVRKKIATHRRERGRQSKIPVKLRAEIQELLKTHSPGQLAPLIGMNAQTFKRWARPKAVANFTEVLVHDSEIRVVLRSGAEIEGLALSSLIELLREGGI